MIVDEEGKKFLVAQEGLRLRIYRDSKGLSTIGVGHLITLQESLSSTIVIAGEKISYLRGLSEQQCFNLLTQDLQKVEKELNAISIKLTQNQFNALASFIFNIGVHAFRTSTLRKAILKENLKQILVQWQLWDKPSEVIPRREREIALWSSE